MAGGAARYRPAIDAERETPLHLDRSVGFPGDRDGASHAGFLLPHLRPGLRLLDCGCGPGQITVDLAEQVAPASVVGVDRSAAEFAAGRAAAARRGLPVAFVEASAYALPFDDGAFDVVFAHALLEHLEDPGAALAELTRVLGSGGVLAVCSPDWGGFIVTPPGPGVDGALAAYAALQRAGGGHPLAGRYLGVWLLEAGLCDVRVDARYERHASPDPIAAHLAAQLDNAGETGHAAALRAWARQPAATFAQTWVSAISTKRR